MRNLLKKRRQAKPKAPGKAIAPVDGAEPQSEPTKALTELVRTLAGEFQASTVLTRLESRLTEISSQQRLAAENMGLLNSALGEFRDSIVVPFREELKHLRYNLGDKINHASTELEVYVARLDNVIRGILSAQGMSPDLIEKYREAHGLQNETPRGHAIAVDIDQAELANLRQSNADLIRQNRRLLAKLAGHRFLDDTEWVYSPNCECEVCLEDGRRRQAAAEAVAERERLGSGHG